MFTSYILLTIVINVNTTIIQILAFIVRALIR